MKTRRGFLGRLLALVAAPWVAKALPESAGSLWGRPILLRDGLLPYQKLILEDLGKPAVFHGSFKIGEITRRVAKQGRFYMNPDQERLYRADLKGSDVSRGTLAAQGFLPEPRKE